MTRRHLFDLMLAGGVGAWGHAANTPGTKAKLAAMVGRLDLAVVPALWTNGLIPEAVAVSGEDAGKLVLPESPWLISVSPDCGWIAWTARGSQPPPLGAGDGQIFFTGAHSRIKSVGLRGCYPEQISLSSGAVYLALTTVGSVRSDARLIVLNPATGELERDVTGLMTRFRIADIDRLRISANGQSLIVGTREFFVVLDVPSRRVLFESPGQFPCFPPTADSVAFINKERELVSASLVTRATTKLMEGWWTTLGLGSWSPDGAFLLAGIRGRLSFFVKLVAIDCATGEFADIVPRLQEGDLGEQSAWVQRGLLAKRTNPFAH